MNQFLATSDKQLGVCLRMLLADGLQGNVETLINDKGKIEFHITANVDDDIMNRLLERYEILIS